MPHILRIVVLSVLLAGCDSIDFTFPASPNTQPLLANSRERVTQVMNKLGNTLFNAFDVDKNNQLTHPEGAGFSIRIGNTFTLAQMDLDHNDKISRAEFVSTFNLPNTTVAHWRSDPSLVACNGSIGP